MISVHRQEWTSVREQKGKHVKRKWATKPRRIHWTKKSTVTILVEVATVNDLCCWTSIGFKAKLRKFQVSKQVTDITEGSHIISQKSYKNTRNIYEKQVTVSSWAIELF